MVLLKDRKYSAQQPRRSSRIKNSKNEYTTALKVHEEKEKELEQLRVDLVADVKQWIKFDWLPEGHTDGDELLFFETRSSANKVQAARALIHAETEKFSNQFDLRVTVLRKSAAEEEASWTEIKTRLIHEKALHEAAERSSMPGV